MAPLVVLPPAADLLGAPERREPAAVRRRRRHEGRRGAEARRGATTWPGRSRSASGGSPRSPSPRSARRRGSSSPTSSRAGPWSTTARRRSGRSQNVVVLTRPDVARSPADERARDLRRPSLLQRAPEPAGAPPPARRGPRGDGPDLRDPLRRRREPRRLVRGDGRASPRRTRACGPCASRATSATRWR